MKYLCYILILISLVACSKEQDMNNVTLLDPIPADKYYSSEIVSAVNLKLYGQLQFMNIYNGVGIAGGPGWQKPTYDYLVFKKYGIYGKIKGNKLIETGKIQIVEQNPSILEIDFKTDTNNNVPYDRWVVEFAGHDSIIMYDASVGCGIYARVYIHK
jgi:hypothetical protein